MGLVSLHYFLQKLNTGEKKSDIHIRGRSSNYISSRKREQSNFCLVGTKTPKKPTTDNILSSTNDKLHLNHFYLNH